VAVKSDTAKEKASDKDPRYWVMPMGNWADPLIKWLETRFRPPTQNKKPSSDRSYAGILDLYLSSPKTIETSKLGFT